MKSTLYYAILACAVTLSPAALAEEEADKEDPATREEAAAGSSV